MYALQSAEYIPSPEWLKKFAKIDYTEAQSLWEAIFSPKNIRLDDIDRIFFEFRDGVYDRRHRTRYFIAGPIVVAPEVASTVVRPIIDSQRPMMEVPETAMPTLRQRSIIELIRETQKTASAASCSSSFLPDFVALPTDDCDEDKEYRVDSETETSTCPETLDEMMLLVKQHRSRRNDVVSNSQSLAAGTYTYSRQYAPMHHASIDDFVGGGK